MKLIRTLVGLFDNPDAPSLEVIAELRELRRQASADDVSVPFQEVFTLVAGTSGLREEASLDLRGEDGRLICGVMELAHRYLGPHGRISYREGVLGFTPYKNLSAMAPPEQSENMFSVYRE